MTQQSVLPEQQVRLNQLIKLYFKAETAKFVVQASILSEVQRDKLYMSTHSTFDSFCQDLFDIGVKMARMQINAYQAAINLDIVESTPIGTNSSLLVPIGVEGTLTERALRPLTPYNNDPELQKDIWQEVLEIQDGHITAKHVNHCVQIVLDQREAASKKFYPLDDWDLLPNKVKKVALSFTGGSKKFNRTTDSIEWALWSWNPVTGCQTNCEYCYARDIANRLYEKLPAEKRFYPTFYPDRLSAPENTKFPELDQASDSIERMGLTNVFVCSMADLFGNWVPTEWIDAVLQRIEDSPQWNFIILTKFPQRLLEFEFPKNAWIGTTVDMQARVKKAVEIFSQLDATVHFLSCEPLLENLTFPSLKMFDWVIIGGASESTKTSEFRPPRDWINSLEDQAHQAGCKVYEKTNLLERIREYPDIEK